MATSVEPRNGHGVSTLPHADTAHAPAAVNPPVAPQPQPPFRHTDRRLAGAPLDMLAVAAAKTLGCGNRISLLAAAAASGAGARVQRQSRDAVAGLLQAHKERLLAAVNQALLNAGRPPV